MRQSNEAVEKSIFQYSKKAKKVKYAVLLHENIVWKENKRSPESTS